MHMANVATFIKTVWRYLRHDRERLCKVVYDQWRSLLIRGGARVYVNVLWPLPAWRPYRRAHLKLWTSGKGVGDEVMCTMVFDAIKQANPACHITFVSRYTELFAGHPSLDQVLPDSSEARAGCVTLLYGLFTPPPRPLGSMMAECVGLVLPRAPVPSLPAVKVSAAFQEAVNRLGRSLIVVQPRSSKWTPNKDWSLERWNLLTEKLVDGAVVVECGTESVLDPMPGLVSYAGKTSLVEFAYLVSKADLFIGPPSGGMNLAAAYRTPSVILYGGYESPEGYQYPTVLPLYRQVPCAPCWLTTSCPHQLECLHQISVTDVLDAVDRQLRQPKAAGSVGQQAALPCKENES
jgi:ADP-heptose:LPS heptosyltransferase